MNDLQDRARGYYLGVDTPMSMIIMEVAPLGLIPLWAGACSGGGGRRISLFRFRISVRLLFKGMSGETLTLGSKHLLLILLKALLPFSSRVLTCSDFLSLDSCFAFLRVLSSAATYFWTVFHISWEETGGCQTSLS